MILFLTFEFYGQRHVNPEYHDGIRALLILVEVTFWSVLSLHKPELV